jgi:hypothetical protein
MTPYKTIKAYECTCRHCDYRWISIKLPKLCGNPACKRRTWNREPLKRGPKATKRTDIMLIRAQTSRENGRNGGRPREYPPCPRYRSHRFVNDRCPCGFTRN